MSSTHRYTLDSVSQMIEYFAKDKEKYSPEFFNAIYDFLENLIIDENELPVVFKRPEPNHSSFLFLLSIYAHLATWKTSLCRIQLMTSITDLLQIQPDYSYPIKRALMVGSTNYALKKILEAGYFSQSDFSALNNFVAHIYRHYPSSKTPYDKSYIVQDDWENKPFPFTYNKPGAKQINELDENDASDYFKRLVEQGIIRDYTKMDDDVTLNDVILPHSGDPVPHEDVLIDNFILIVKELKTADLSDLLDLTGVDIVYLVRIMKDITNDGWVDTEEINGVPSYKANKKTETYVSPRGVESALPQRKKTNYKHHLNWERK